MRIIQTILPTAIYTLYRDASPPESEAAKNCSIEIGEQPQSNIWCWLQGNGPRGPNGGDHSVECLWRTVKHGSRAIWFGSHTGVGAISVVSLSPLISTGRLKNPSQCSQCGPLSYWFTKQWGSPSGWHFKCMIFQATENDNNLNRPRNRKGQVKEIFWFSAARGWNDSYDWGSVIDKDESVSIEYIKAQ